MTDFVARARELDANATPGPWSANEHTVFCPWGANSEGVAVVARPFNPTDATFIAEARALVPLMAEEIEAQRTRADTERDLRILMERDLNEKLDELREQLGTARELVKRYRTQQEQLETTGRSYLVVDDHQVCDEQLETVRAQLEGARSLLRDYVTFPYDTVNRSNRDKARAFLALPEAEKPIRVEKLAVPLSENEETT